MSPPQELRPSWARSDRPIPRRVVRPMQEFLQTSTAGGVVLLGAAVLALAWASGPLSASYARVWRTPLGVDLGPWSLERDLRFWVSEGLMSLFFLVVGLEIKRELLSGDLRGFRRAVLPFVSAGGGMAVPAVLYLLFVHGTGARAWGAVMPTDIAFTLGVVALASRHVPAGLKPFLLALAIADDLVTIVVLALFSSTGVEVVSLAFGGAATVAIVALQRADVRWPAAYVLLGVGIWVSFWRAGVHPALAGAVVGLLTPSRPLHRPRFASQEAIRTARETVDDPRPPDMDLHWWLRLTSASRDAVSPLARVEHALLPWCSYVVLPLFALANAGVHVTAGSLGAAAHSPIAIAMVLTRLVGKVVGIVGVAWLAVRVKAARLPQGVGWGHLVGGACAAGIAFTVSLYVVEGVFTGGSKVLDASKMGILASGFLGASISLLVLRRARVEGDV